MMRMLMRVLQVVNVSAATPRYVWSWCERCMCTLLTRAHLPVRDRAMTMMRGLRLLTGWL